MMGRVGQSKKLRNVLSGLARYHERERVTILDYEANKSVFDGTIAEFHETSGKDIYMQCLYKDVCNAEVLKTIVTKRTIIIFIDSEKIKMLHLPDNAMAK